jgi:hypothetical protein
MEKKYQPFKKVMSEEEKKDATMKAMFLIAQEQSKNVALVQDQMEGVADDEW